MRILVTGATGFVGRWLCLELTANGHEVVPTGSRADLDVTDPAAVQARVADDRVDAVAHLAGISFAPDARDDPDRARAVNEGGARNIVTAVGGLAQPTPVLLVSSADVYGPPVPAALPLTEDAPLAADQPYGRSKLAAERAATELAEAHRVPLVIARSFNHAGPGQRLAFVVPAIASRIIAARERGEDTISAGNVDVRRDIGDVRDVARAYRLLLEMAVERSDAVAHPLVVNVATGRSVTIRSVIDELALLAGIEVAIRVDPELVRPNDPPDIRGDASRLTAATGWSPRIPLSTTLADVLADVRTRTGTTAAPNA
jgi:GDP-4-dehydro-6-deoxy-D-mannose reductase